MALAQRKPHSAWSDVCTLATAAFLLVTPPQSKAPSHSITIALADPTTTPSQTTSTPWHNVNIEQAEAQGILRSLNAITDPKLQKIVADYATTDYFKNGLANGEKNRLWVVTAAAGIQDMWDNSEKRSAVESIGLGIDSAMTLELLNAAIESYFGTVLSNKKYGAVGGIWHIEDETALRTAAKYMRASDYSVNDGITEDSFKQFQDAVAKVIKDNEKNNKAITKILLPSLSNNDPIKKVADVILKTRSYARLGVQLHLLLQVEMARQVINQTNLTIHDFKNHPELFYINQVFGAPMASDFHKIGGGDIVAHQSRKWAGYAAANKPIFYPIIGKNKNGTVIYGAAFTKDQVRNRMRELFHKKSYDLILNKTGWNLTAQPAQLAASATVTRRP